MNSRFLTPNVLQSGRGKFGRLGLAFNMQSLEAECVECAELASLIARSGNEAAGRRLGRKLMDVFSRHGVTQAIVPSIRLSGSYQEDWIRECENLGTICREIAAEARAVQEKILGETSVVDQPDSKLRSMDDLPLRFSSTRI